MSGPEQVEKLVAGPPAAPPLGAEPFRLGAEPPTVMRLSRRALAIIGGVSGVAIGGALLYALQPAAPKVPENLYDSDRANKSELVTGAPGDYGKIPKLGEPLPGDLGRPILAAREKDEAVPVPPIGAPTKDPRVAAAEQSRARAAQERESARASQLFLGSGASAATALPELGGSGPQASADGPRPNAVAADRRRGFLRGGGARPTESMARIVAPSSPHVIQAGSVIPAALITGIRSDLPGQITAQVTQNVYDSPTGRFLLIPQGARLIGEYDSEIADGQSRVLLVWERLILPGGRSIALDREPGADASGRAGLSDRTDHHWGRVLRAALVSTMLGIGAEAGSGGDGALIRALRDGTQDSANEAGQRIVEREMKVPPTLTIRPGHPLRVIVTRDLVFESEGGEG
ncbi:TrbI/VirB10 family protein [Sphingopyxis sp. YF1]|uniref:TrbI/VirB10 family protein n=1 Tax=Sphingopyxis sp. YF1 TaxID=2482763 RepID=UPI001F605952|nr:TrbI/VirB10 family protein [Sphingopyxis sp. YF1]UNU44469.1 TrbI/VirB10 family protein [Sphingopyxis sp. YF1]